MGIFGASSEIGNDENPLVVDIKRLDRVIASANGINGRHHITDEHIQERIKERDQKIRKLLDMIKNKSYKHGLSNDDIKIYKRNTLTKNRNRYKQMANKKMENELKLLNEKKWYEIDIPNTTNSRYNSRYKSILDNIQKQINNTVSLTEAYRIKQYNINAQLKNLNKVELPNGVTINNKGRPQRHTTRGGNRTYCAKRRPSCITHRRKGS